MTTGTAEPVQRVPRGILYLLISLLLGSITSIAVAYAAADSVTVTFLRFLFGTILFSPLILRMLKKADRLPPLLWVSAFMSASSVLFFFISLAYIDAALAVAISSLGPITVLLFERALHVVSLPRRTILIIVLATAGAIIASSSSLTSVGSTVGVLLALLSTITGSLGVVLQVKARTDASAWVRTESINIAGLILTVPLVIISGFHPTLPTVNVALFAAIAGGGLSIVLLLQALHTVPASIASAIMSAGLPVTALLGWLLLQQDINISQAIGYAIIIIASILLSFSLPSPVALPTQEKSEPPLS